MVNHLKFKTKDQNIFFWSDLHVCHSLPSILAARKFNNAEEGKEILINNWNSKVTNNDIGFLLGDSVVGAGKDGELIFKELLMRLNYKELYLMCGNHYSGYRQTFNDSSNLIDKHYRLPINGDNKTAFLIPNYYEVFVDRYFMVLSHYSLFSWYQMKDERSYMLFGHHHSNINNKIKGKTLDVTPESVGLFPLSFEEIKNIMDTKEHFSPDYH